MRVATEAPDTTEARPMPPTSRLPRPLQALALAVVTIVLAFLAVVLAAFAAAALLVGLVLHRLGWDRRLVAYLMRKQGVHVSTFRHAREPEAGGADAPIEAQWTLVEERRPD